MVRELFYIPDILYQFLASYLCFNILLFLFVSSSEATHAYVSLSPLATLYLLQDLPQYSMKSIVDTQFLNMLHSYRNIQHLYIYIYIYIYITLSCDTKEHQYIFCTASYSWSHNHTSNQLSVHIESL